MAQRNTGKKKAAQPKMKASTRPSKKPTKKRIQAPTSQNSEGSRKTLFAFENSFLSFRGNEIAEDAKDGSYTLFTLDRYVLLSVEQYLGLLNLAKENTKKDSPKSILLPSEVRQLDALPKPRLSSNRVAYERKRRN
jgi:hypothetical protein